MKSVMVIYLLFVGSLVETKPVNLSIHEKLNEMDYGEVENRVKVEMIGQESTITLTTSYENWPYHVIKYSEKDNQSNQQGTVFTESILFKPHEWLSWLLGPLIQRVQFSSQSFFQDKLALLKQTLNNLGFTTTKNVTAKQLDSANGLIHLISPYDSDFYTSRLEQAGFFGGNGWFANKGGILGGPGALLSTGNLLTDYTIAYRK